MFTNQNASLRTFLSCLVITIAILASITVAVARRPSSSTITIVNNSALEIRHVYLSPVDNNNWGADQLNDSATIAAGASFTVSDVSCAQGSVKVIAEDQNGCFFYTTTDCAANSTWTITSSATPDCGQ